MRTASRIAVLGVGLLVGCSATRSTLRDAPPATLRAESVVEWQQLVRPDLLMLIGTMVAIVDSKEGECPLVSRDGPRTTVQGGCTDTSGNPWTGQALQVVEDTRVRARLRAFGHGGRRVDGRVDVRSEPEPSFVMKVVATERDDDRRAHWLAIDARGRRTAGGEWSAEGEVATDELGRVDLRAEGIVLDGDACAHEPLRGHLELRSDQQRVRIDYDGATDCDPTGTARWSLNGVDQGELEGVGGELRCNPDSNGSAPTGTGLLLGLGMLGRRRRRRDRAECRAMITPERGSCPDRHKTEASTSEC